MKASEVFTPGHFPTYTFVDRHLKDAEQQLAYALDAKSMLVSLSGPSKSGKTVFIQRMLGEDSLVQLTGAGIGSPGELWKRVFDAIGTPVKSIKSRREAHSGKVATTGETEWNFFVVKPKGSLSGEVSLLNESTKTEEYAVDPLQMAIKELSGTEITVIVDDFHYIPKKVQIEIAQQIKEAIRQGVQFICASVPHHSDDVIRSNPDLQGRVVAIDLHYWEGEYLKSIADIGFKHLGIDCTDEMISKMADESAGSPQLMQSLCLHACHEFQQQNKFVFKKVLEYDRSFMEIICKKTASTINYSTIIERIVGGPKQRRSDRKIYLSKLGWQGDVYKFLRQAIALDPPLLTFHYQDLADRIYSICNGDKPSGSSIATACKHAAKIGNLVAAKAMLEWDSENDVFNIRDPYFLFYARWAVVK